jgi:hypothetical protein
MTGRVQGEERKVEEDGVWDEGPELEKLIEK